MSKRVVAVTGACGFIGRYVVDKLLARGEWVYAIDALTYAADPNLPSIWQSQYPKGQFKFVARDLLDLGFWPDIQAVIHLAAETHVDNSLNQSDRFLRTNILGTQHLLEMTRGRDQYGMPTFIHISTDEVYGDVTKGATDESAPLNPSSPYAASKAAADCLVQAWGRTYGLPYRIIRPSNCYGTGQYPEKLIPKAVRHLTLGQQIPIHGDGSAVRSWLWVEDCADAILRVLDDGCDGAVYNVPGNTLASVREIVTTIAETPEALSYGYERRGLDTRYCVTGTPLETLGWFPRGNFWRDLPVLVAAERKGMRW